MKIKNLQLWQLIIVHFKELIREPGVLFWGIMFPVLMAGGLGMAFTQKKDVTREIAVVDMEAMHSPEFLQLIEQCTIENTAEGVSRYRYTISDTLFGNTTLLFVPTSWDKALVKLKRGTITLILTEAADSVQYHFDPVNPDARLLYIQLSGLLGQAAAVRLSDVGAVVPLEMKGTRYIDFLIPGLIGMNIMMACMWGISYTLIERRKGNMLRRMIVTPMRRSNLLAALLTARFVLNFIEIALIIVFAFFLFDITIQGSIPALVLILLAGNIAFGGLAILMSSHTSKTEIGNALINVVTMPMMILSGIFFSYQNFPEWSLPVIKAMPLTMLTDSIRSIFNEGATFADVLLPSSVLTVIGLVCSAIGLSVFKWY